MTQKDIAQFKILIEKFQSIEFPKVSKKYCQFIEDLKECVDDISNIITAVIENNSKKK